MGLKKNVLYVSYDGMTDPLGQSQVIPYLSGLSKKYNITLLSAEKPEIFASKKEKIATLLQQENINWQPVFYTKKPPVLSTLKDVYLLKRNAKKLYQKQKFNIVHCRSYISAFIGVYLKRKYGCSFVFDMRGFWPDERVDGNIWSLKNPLFKQVYHFFKHKEKLFMSFSDAIVSLTQAGKNEILKWNLPGVDSHKIAVIPCCADFNHFDIRNVLPEGVTRWKAKLNIMEQQFVLTYLGSVGTWYMLPEMLHFFSELKKKKPESVFLFITKDNPENIFLQANKYGINASDIRVQSAERIELPNLISMSDAAIFFIKPVWSKKASSPTKMAELMGLGIPIIANEKVGDVGLVMEKNPTGILVDEFNETAYNTAIDQLLALTDKKQGQVHELACEYFSLDTGIAIFSQIYSKLSE